MRCSCHPASKAAFLYPKLQAKTRIIRGAPKFNTPGNGGVMPWWGNSSLAQQFATTVFSSLPGSFPPEGAFFAFDNSVEYWQYSPFSSPNIMNPSANPASSFVYAQATLVTPASVPGPLPIMGAATAFGMSRRLRRRIASQSHKL